MYSILNFVLRYSGAILFIILEITCMYIVVQYNQKQRDIYTSSSNIISGGLYQQYDRLARYWRLQSISDSLSTDNAQLYAQLANAKYSNYIRRDSIKNRDSLNQVVQQYTYTAAAVVNNSISNFNNYFTIDKGSVHGIRSGMGVITPQGAIGIVKNVTEHYAQVMSVLHQQSKVSASIKKSKYFGTLGWRGRDPLHINLDAIPKHATIAVGDTVQTSGYSNIFPEGIPIGKIEKFEVDASGNFFTIQVILFEDIARLRYVYIVDHLMHKEIEVLDQSIKETQGKINGN
jgi:rod shape-determining protein MreC